jgi:Cu(I)/Ag(I) efflux system membrane fusion protein
MKIKEFFKNSYITGSLLLVAGLFLGWLFFHQPGNSETNEKTALHEHSEEENTIWTCAMHPQIRMDEPGQCPICGMDLIPLQNSNVEIDDQAIEMSESAMKLAEIQTYMVSKGNALKEVALFGKIKPDERLLQSQTAHVPGRIEQLFINVTGETVKKGQLIAKIYSPELVTAQKELLESISLAEKYPSVVEAAREKLRNWKLTDQQIQEIEISGKVTTTVDIYANTSGIVIDRKVNEGDYVSKGAVLFDVADLSQVWAVFDAYESDLQWINMIQKAEFTTQSIPGKVFSGNISFIDPVIDPATRIARVRIEIVNPGFQLKPEMFINGIVKSNKGNSGQQLTVPQSAVLWTGTRSVVYVKIPGTEVPAFKMREIILGASMKDDYIVLEGLQEGEEIVTNGAFSVDAAAQLAGKPSMMNPAGGKISTEHNHGETPMNEEEMENMDKQEAPKKEASTAVPMDFKMQLGKVMNQYLLMKDAFVANKSNYVTANAKTLKNQLEKVDMALLSGQVNKDWMEFLSKLDAAIEQIITAKDIEIQREGFANFNLVLYYVIKEYGLTGETIYYQYCPMAFDSRGAFWFSEKKEIENPYFGDAMLKCGETRETFEFN